MTDKPRYWKQPFFDQFIEALNRDSTFQKAARSLDDRIILRCLDDPDGKDISATYRIDRGTVTVQLQIEDAPSDRFRRQRFDKGAAMARVTAPYHLWARLDRKEISVVRALASPEYHIEGKLKILANIKTFNAMSEVASNIDKSY